MNLQEPAIETLRFLSADMVQEENSGCLEVQLNKIGVSKKPISVLSG